MPIYDYACAEHGSFELMRPMSASGDAAPCPECGNLAARIITAPNLRTLGGQTRSAMERNEKSRHAPHVCGAECHHRTAPSRVAAESSSRPKLTSYRGPRPWVVEHR